MNPNLKAIQIHLFGICAVVLCLSCAYVFGVRPVLNAHEQLQQVAIEGEQLQAALPKLETQLVELSEKIAAKKQAIRDNYAIKTYIEQPLIGIVSQLLSNRHMELSNLREESMLSTGDITIALQITGDYLDMVNFLADIQRLDRPARISALTLTPMDELGQRFSSRVSIVFSPPIALPIAG